MKYEIKFSCGHIEEVNIYGKRKFHSEKIEWLSKNKSCSACRKEAEERENAKISEFAEQQAIEYELPELIGSNTQIEWAKILRYKMINKILNFFDGKRIFDDIKEYDAFVYLTKKANASYWIDIRNEFPDDIMKKIAKEYQIAKNEKTPEAIKAKEEAILVPELQQHDGVVEVTVSKNKISIKYALNEDFRLTVKRNGYLWNCEKKSWERICDDFTGNSIDRAAEIINILLNKGFAVICFDDVIRKKAIKANFAPECKKWIKYNNDKFIVKWSRDEDNDYYNRLRRIPGAKWNSSEKGMTLPTTSYREIDDFADIEGFKFSEQANLIIEELRKAEIIVTPNRPQEQKQQNKLAKILNSRIDVLDDLRDDD